MLCDVPEQLDAEFLLTHHIDVVAVEEGISLDPGCSEARYQAYEALKGLGTVSRFSLFFVLLWALRCFS